MDVHKRTQWPDGHLELGFHLTPLFLTPKFFSNHTEDEEFKSWRWGCVFLFATVAMQKDEWKGPTAKKAGFHHG